MSDLLLWAGAALVSVGSAMFVPWLGIVVAGIFLILFGFLNGIPPKRSG